MKKMKRLCALILLLSLVLLPGLRAAAESPAPAAEESPAPVVSSEPVSRIIDNAGVWSASLESEFGQTAAHLAETYETDIVLLSVHVLQDASLGDRVYDSAAEFAGDYYVANGFGFGGDSTGMIFVFLKEAGNRQYAFRVAGGESYTEEDAAYVVETLQPYFEGGDYDDAARRYLELAREHEEKGSFEGNQTKAESSNFLWTFGLALLVAWAITSSMKRRMRPVQKATAARNYTVRNSFVLRRYNEIYLGTTVQRMPRSQTRQSR